MNILITGANGQLGKALNNVLKSDIENEVFATDIDILDICKQADVEQFIKSNSIDIIVNCAAYTAVDKAENDSDNAFLLNSTAPTNLAKEAKKAGISYITISTDYVFDGKAFKPLTEDDITNPLSVYGKSKLEGEKQVLKANPNSIIIRTSWLYSSYGNNFVKTITKIAKQNDTIRVVSDQIGSPTNAKNLAEAIFEIMKFLKNNTDKSYGGIYHYSNEGVCSWYDFAKAILEFQNIKTNVIAVSSDDFKTIAKRPYYSVLNKKKIKEVFNLEIPHWQESLKANLL
ncbi:MAG: dTDP-4-dehydrorhamnose reductase [Bacteroidales bacterium]|nr:dTDP-4-dehydrorhamnose reductase [Bacteroidales bacterium]